MKYSHESLEVPQEGPSGGFFAVVYVITPQAQAVELFALRCIQIGDGIKCLGMTEFSTRVKTIVHWKTQLTGAQETVLLATTMAKKKDIKTIVTANEFF